MKTFHIEATINTPLETCWEAWANTKVASKWLGTTFVGTKVGEDYRVSNSIPYLSGRHEILEIVTNKKLKLRYFIDGWASDLTVKFEGEEGATKIIIDFSVDIKGAPKSIEPLRPTKGWGFNFIRGSWNHVICELRSLLENKEAGVVMLPQNNDHVINLYIDIKSTPEKIFNALINQQQMQEWMGDDFVLENGEVDPKVGGVYSYGWYPKGTPEKDLDDGPSKILKLEKNKLVVHNWHGCLKIAEISYSIEDQGNGVTRLNFKHSPILGISHGNVWSYRSGWSEGLYGLKWYLERVERNKCWLKSK